ncbi:MAG: PLP-dependent lyase/thiolase [Ilumatobacter sp.]|uniref:PLP-dependent lyase/thiolase n=1 Tax=Ilumatobacter sp. TaxID=1967498 RepID=UPI00261E6808|nr:PLP-dependent lyase/thiolase [Ilumatobacter sp.]MDJ0770596.1 PLP-dependent lyase/thiolase [Ilumatobacter sp.]
MIAGFKCAVCGTDVDIGTPFAWRCPQATADDPYHVLHIVRSDSLPPALDDPNPFLRYGPRLAWWAFAQANGMTGDACAAITREVAADFVVTSFERSDALSSELDLDLWVKDETGNVAGSHKARHLASILMHLRAAESLGLLAGRPPLAIASCGNAALAAATLAARVDWPLDVYVPTWMDDAFGSEIERLGGRIHRCERRDHDPPGDPAMLRFRDARDAGAIPFTVQGPENAYCLDGGRTLGWEIADQAVLAGVKLDRVVVQVGGGAFAASVGAGLGHAVRLDTVQAEGCAPLAATWDRIASIEQPERYWSQVMRPWPEPHSIADGILDDETYDWIAVTEAMVESGGRPIVALERDIVRARQLATDAGFAVSATGAAGLAGVLTAREHIHDGDHIAVVMSGVAR